MIATHTPPVKVLLVDDDMDLLSLMKSRLTEHGFDVAICPNGDGIYSILANRPPDCILLDLHMDGINGEELCREIKSHSDLRNIPVLLVSSDVEIVDAEKRCGADGYINKPLDIQELTAKIGSMSAKN